MQLIGSTHTILALVNTGMGIALVPASAQNLHFDNVMFRPIRVAPSVRAELFLVWRRDNNNPAVRLVNADQEPRLFDDEAAVFVRGDVARAILGCAVGAVTIA